MYKYTSILLHQNNLTIYKRVGPTVFATYSWSIFFILIQSVWFLACSVNKDVNIRDYLPGTGLVVKCMKMARCLEPINIQVLFELVWFGFNPNFSILLVIGGWSIQPAFLDNYQVITKFSASDPLLIPHDF
jgi:hypothetical protein